MAAGGLRVARYHQVVGGMAKRQTRLKVVEGEEWSRVFCIDCALKRGYVRWLPGREPNAKALASVPWAGKGVIPVRMVKYGSKWEAV